jgi:hypothetical protein
MCPRERPCGNAVSPIVYIATGTIQTSHLTITTTYINTLKIKSIVLVLRVRQKLGIRATADTEKVAIIEQLIISVKTLFV